MGQRQPLFRIKDIFEIKKENDLFIFCVISKSKRIFFLNKSLQNTIFPTKFEPFLLRNKRCINVESHNPKRIKHESSVMSFNVQLWKKEKIAIQAPITAVSYCTFIHISYIIYQMSLRLMATHSDEIPHSAFNARRIH